MSGRLVNSTQPAEKIRRGAPHTERKLVQHIIRLPEPSPTLALSKQTHVDRIVRQPASIFRVVDVSRKGKVGRTRK